MQHEYSREGDKNYDVEKVSFSMARKQDRRWMADARQYDTKRALLACEGKVLTEKSRSDIFVTIRCSCGQYLGEAFGFFRLPCHKKKKHGGKKVIIQGYTDQGKAVIEEITPEILRVVRSTEQAP